MSFTFPYETVAEEVAIGPYRLQVEKLKSLDETIDGFFSLYETTGREELFEDLCPYFGVPWPAGTALARFAAANAERWRGKKVLELACGLALPTLVLAKSGQYAPEDLTASDLHPDVPEFFRRNLKRNGLGAAYLSLDWRHSFTQTDLILASDLLYDRYQPAALLKFLVNSTWGEVILADPQRPYWDEFVKAASQIFHAEQFADEKIRFLRLVAKVTS